MWILQKNGCDEEEYKLLMGKEYVVGRKDVDIVLNNDQSISRKHAVIAVKTDAGQEEPRPVLRDSSKYGTTINGQPCSEEHRLGHGDAIQFGVFDNCWTIIRRPLVCSTSCLSTDEKTVVQKLVSILGGQILAEWTDQCSLLIMDKLTVTMKVINALLSLKRVVTSRYLQDVVDAARTHTKNPDPARYLPPFEVSEFVDETVDFSPNDARTTLFSATTFVSFAAKQAKKMALVMRQAGARLKLEPASTSSLEEWIVRDDVCVLRPPSNSVPSDFERTLVKFLKTRDKRYIPEAEVGLAVLYCSRSRYCHPSNGFGSDPIVPSSIIMQESQMVSQYRSADTQITEDRSSANVEEEAHRTLRMTEDTVPSTDALPEPISAIVASCDPLDSDPRVECDVNFDSRVVRPSPSSNDVHVIGDVPKDEPMAVSDEEETEPWHDDDDEDVVDGTKREDEQPKITNRSVKTITYETKTESKTCIKNEFESASKSFVVVKYASLVCRRKHTTSRSVGSHLDVNNFKRFKKVPPKNVVRDVADYRTITTGVRRRPRLEMLQRVTQSQSSNFSQNNGDSQDDDDQEEPSDAAKLFDW